MAFETIDANDANARFVVSTNTAFDTATGTFVFWLNLGANGEQEPFTIFDRTSAAAHDGIFIWRHDAANSKVFHAITFNASGASCDLTSTTVFDRDDTWRHVAFTFATANGATNKLYVNGAEEDSDTNSAGWSFGANDISWGRARAGIGQNQADATRWAECAWYDTQLSAANIAALAKGFSPLLVQPVSLVEYWPMVSILSLDNNEPADIGRINGFPVKTVTGANPSTQHVSYPHPRVFSPTVPRGMRAGGISLVKARRTLNALGTRVGTRQLHGGV